MRKLKLEELGRLSNEDFKKAEKTPYVLILDDVRSLNNVGSAFRTSDAFRIEKIILAGITGKPPHREIQKTALGATESVQWEYEPNVLQSIQSLKKSGYKIICLEQTTESIPLHKVKVKEREKYAFVFGNEVKGVGMDILEESDQVVEIPQLGTKHSLNISVSIGIVLWNFASSGGYIK